MIFVFVFWSQLKRQKNLEDVEVLVGYMTFLWDSWIGETPLPHRNICRFETQLIQLKFQWVHDFSRVLRNKDIPLPHSNNCCLRPGWCSCRKTPIRVETDLKDPRDLLIKGRMTWRLWSRKAQWQVHNLSAFAKMIADRNVLRKTSAPSCHDGLTSSMTSSRGEASQLFGLHFHLGFRGAHWWLMRNYAVTMRSQASCSRCWWISILPAIFLMSCLFLKSSHNQRLASEKGAVLWLIWEVVDSWLIEPFWETEKAEIEVFVKSPSKQLESQSESCMQFKRLAWFPWPNPGSKSGQSWLGQRRRKPRSM